MTDTSRAYRPQQVAPSGDTLAEVLEARGMTQRELAQRTGLSTKHINQIIKSAAAISPETALLLERATGVASATWNRLEVNYRDHLSRVGEESQLAADVDWLDELPVNELIKRRYIERCKEPIDQLREVYRFFGVANRAAWVELWNKPTAYRTSRAFAADPGAVAAWLRVGELQAADIDCAPFDRRGLGSLIDELRSFTCDREPARWWPRLVDRCAAVGVAVVTEREIKGARINGAARWLTPDKAIVQLSLRHRWSDIFWFTFFHEVGHLLIHSKKDTFINDPTAVHSIAEQEADAFAAQVLIPRGHEPELASLTTKTDVISFAERIGVSPGIVVGRLQHDKRWPYNRGNDLKQRFEFIDD